MIVNSQTNLLMHTKFYKFVKQIKIGWKKLEKRFKSKTPKKAKLSEIYIYNKTSHIISIKRSVINKTY